MKIYNCNTVVTQVNTSIHMSAIDINQHQSTSICATSITICHDLPISHGFPSPRAACRALPRAAELVDVQRAPSTCEDMSRPALNIADFKARSTFLAAIVIIVP